MASEDFSFFHYLSEQKLVSGELVYVCVDTIVRKGVPPLEDLRTTLTRLEKVARESV